MQPLVRTRHGGDQRFGVFVIGRAEDLSDGAGFNHLTTIHHADAIGNFGNDADVVGDNDDAQITLPTQRLDQVEDLFLDRDIQRCRRLIRDHQIGVARQRQGDNHTLPHPA